MPQGKAAGQRCVQLNEANDCRLFGRPDRPEVCRSLRATHDMCGATREHALRWLGELELATAPAATSGQRATAARTISVCQMPSSM